MSGTAIPEVVDHLSSSWTATPEPEDGPPFLNAIPASLTDLPRWVGWKLETRPEKPDEKPTKVPKSWQNFNASSTKPKTWTDFDTIVAAFKKTPPLWDGVGIVLGDLGNREFLIGFDFDSCIVDRNVAPWALPLIAAMPSYIEVSPSETGLKAFLRCRADDIEPLHKALGLEKGIWGCRCGVGGNGKDHGPAIEVYLSARYFTVTGFHWPDTPDEVELLDLDALLRVAELVRHATGGAGSNGTGSGNGKDDSRSAKAWHIGLDRCRQGGTFEDMCAAIRNHPETAEWYRDKGEPNDRRELKRIWNKVNNNASTADATQFFDPWAELQPPPFPIDALPPVLRAFAEDRSRVIGADPCGIAWASISACSAALHGGIRLRMKKHDLWSVPPSIWVALVGRSATTMKTPTIEAAWGPLQRAQQIYLNDWSIARAEWKATPKNERSQDEPQAKLRFVSHDGTMEAIQDILGRQDRGIGVLRDELSGWIGSLEKYGGQKGSSADRAFFLQAFNGGPNVIDRVTRGTIAVRNLLVTICGGIQPERLQQFAELSDDGLWQRFIGIICAPAQRGIDERPGPAVANYETTVNSLLAIPGDVCVALSEEAHEIRADVEDRLYELVQSDVLGPRFASFSGKLAGIWGRLALVLNYLDPTQGASFIVSRTTAERASTLLFSSVIPCAAKIYALTGGAGADAEATQAVAGYILTKQKGRVLSSDLAHNVRACRGQPLDHVQRVVSPLVAGGWLTPEKEWNPVSWRVAEGVHVVFAERAAKETVRRTAIHAVLRGMRRQDA